jgi:hypothetical protein
MDVASGNAWYQAAPWGSCPVVASGGEEVCCSVPCEVLQACIRDMSDCSCWDNFAGPAVFASLA